MEDAGLTDFAIVSSTVPSVDEARGVARALVEAKLAACVQILPIESIYRWEGAVETAQEHLLLCKITAADFSAVEARIRACHAYDVPEIVITSIVAGGASYLEWLARSTRRETTEQKPP